jgi:hypothetical protein
MTLDNDLIALAKLPITPAPLARRISFKPAWDRTNDPSGKNYGVHGVDMEFVLTGPKGAINFLVYTGWHLPSVWNSWRSRGLPTHDYQLCDGAMICYHARKRTGHEDRESEECEYLDGKCYSGCWYSAAGALFWEFVEKGEDVVWAELTRRYEAVFNV